MRASDAREAGELRAELHLQAEETTKYTKGTKGNHELLFGVFRRPFQCAAYREADRRKKTVVSQ